MKKLKKWRVVLMCALAATVFNACEYQSIESVIPDEVSFSEDIQPIFHSKCIACHYTGGRQAPDLTEAYAFEALIEEGYVIPDSSEISVLYQKVESGHPSTGSMTSTEIKFVKLWIDDGALDN